jgi:hypothetical protein
MHVTTQHQLASAGSTAAGMLQNDRVLTPLLPGC